MHLYLMRHGHAVTNPVTNDRQLSPTGLFTARSYRSCVVNCSADHSSHARRVGPRQRLSASNETTMEHGASGPIRSVMPSDVLSLEVLECPVPDRLEQVFVGVHFW